MNATRLFLMQRFVCLALVAGVAAPVSALSPEPDAVFVRVVDVGPGLCVFVKLPDGDYLVYDGGHWAGGGQKCFGGVEKCRRHRHNDRLTRTFAHGL